MPRILTDTDIAGFRDRLCDLATRLLVERGPENFNMRLLASEMGVSAMTPYRYFHDKDEILSLIRARTFGRLASQLEEALVAPGSLPERNAAVMNAYVRFALDEQTCYRLIFDLADLGAPPAPELAQAEARARAAMTDPVRMMVDHGYYRGDADLISHVFWASLHGLLVLHLSGKLEVDFNKALDEMCVAFENAYRVRTTA